MYQQRKLIIVSNSFLFKQLVNSILNVISLITVVCVFVPFSPWMPAEGLDPSWVFGMNQAVAQGLSFGKELIFTFGPYASIYTKSYHPSTDFMMISGSLYLALSYWACIVLLTKGVQWRWTLTFCATLAGLMYSRDTLLFSLPLLVGLLTFKTLSTDEGNLVKRRLPPFYVALLIAPLGLLPLVKGSILILCVAIAVLCSLFFIAHRRRSLAIICLASPLVSMLFFWIASGQSVATLPSYFISMAPIISGYTEAMAVDGIIREVIFYLMASASLLLAISIQKQLTASSRIFLSSIYCVYLFIAFKGGFVRHDGHAGMSGISLLIAAVLLPFIFNPKIILHAIILPLISWAYIDSHYFKTSAESVVNNFKSTYSSAWNGFKNRISDKSWPRRDFDSAIRSLKAKAKFPVLQGTTDIYSYNQSYLIASGNSWNPRPIPQSYSVYTPALAEINRRHLLDNEAPNNIVFRVEPIDGRIPSVEDGASWPVFLEKYFPTMMQNDFLYLHKKGKVEESHNLSIIGRGSHAFGEEVDLSITDKPVFAEIEIRPNILGRLANIFFKPSQLQITLVLKNGALKQYRMIAGMAKSGLLVSPLIEDTADFLLLYGNRNYLADKTVKSISIAPSGGKISLWNNEYFVTLKQVNLPQPINILNFYNFDGLADNVSSYRVTTAEKCDGSIDMINGTFPAQMQLSASGILKVNGWLASSVVTATLPDTVFVVLTDNKGKRTYLNTRQTPRPDVGAYFNRPGLNNSGYATNADISKFDGEYFLGLASKRSETIEICPQFKIPITITK